jgi:hypothetical protein
MSTSEVHDSGANLPELRSRHFRRDFLYPLLREQATGTSGTADAALYSRILDDVIDWWLPLAAAANCFPPDVVKSRPEWEAEVLRDDGEMAVVTDPRTETAELLARVEELARLELDADTVYDALNVCVTFTSDAVANTFLAQLLTRELPTATSLLQERTLGASDAELALLAAHLPAWMTDGPYRYRANLAFWGEQWAGNSYVKTKRLLRHREIVDGDTYWGEPDYRSYREFRFALVRTERQLVPDVRDFEDWISVDPDPWSRLPQRAGRNPALNALVGSLKWRLTLPVEAQHDLRDYTDALRPVVEAVMSEHLSQTSQSQGETPRAAPQDER